MLHLPVCIEVTWTSERFGTVRTAVRLLPSVLHRVRLGNTENVPLTCDPVVCHFHNTN